MKKELYTPAAPWDGGAGVSREEGKESDWLSSPPSLPLEVCEQGGGFHMREYVLSRDVGSSLRSQEVLFPEDDSTPEILQRSSF